MYNTYLSGQSHRLALKAIMLNYKDFMGVIHLQLSTVRGRRCVQKYGGSFAEASTNLVFRIIFALGRRGVTGARSILHLIVLAVGDGNLPYKNLGFFVLQKFQFLHFEASQ